MPEPRQHEWVAIAAFKLGHDQIQVYKTAAQLYGEGHPDEAQAFLDEHPFRITGEGLHHDPHVGCYTCEIRLVPESFDSPCPGEPVGYNEKGEPTYADA